MKIGLAGTMSVGKTTLARALGETDRFKDHVVQTERSKYLSNLGIPLNTDSTLPGQFIFLAERASELLQPNIITDRTIWDVCSFTMLAKSIGTHDKSQFVNAAMTLREQYDIVFYIEPVGVEMEDNGVRETNLEYRADINQEILRLLSLFPPKKLVILHGSTKDRVKTVLDALK
jgi:nicotinamide riboside kinase